MELLDLLQRRMTPTADCRKCRNGEPIGHPECHQFRSFEQTGLGAILRTSPLFSCDGAPAGDRPTRRVYSSETGVVRFTMERIDYGSDGSPADLRGTLFEKL